MNNKISKKDKFFSKILEYMLYLFVFVLPWQTRWIFKDYRVGENFFEFGRMGLYAFDLIILAMLLIFLLAKSIRVKFTNIISKAEGIGLSIFIILLAVMAYSAWFFAIDSEIAHYWLTRFVVAFLLLLLILKINFSQIKLIVAFVTSACLQALLGIWQVIHNEVMANKWLGMAWHQADALAGESVIAYGDERLLRAYGSLPHPNILAGFLVVVFAMLIYLILKTEKSWQRWFLFSSFSLILSGIFLTFSLSAWLATLGVIIFLFAVFAHKSTYDTRRLAKALGAWAIILVTILSLLFLAPLKTRILGDGRLEEISFTERSASMRNAYYIALNHTPRGVGLGNYVQEVRRLDRDSLPISLYQPVHNVYFLAWAELGLVGGISMLLLLLYFCARMVAAKEDQFTGYPLPLLISGSAMGVVFFLMFFDHYFWTTAFGIYLWFFVMGFFMRNIGINKDEVLPKEQLLYKKISCLHDENSSRRDS